MAYRETLFRKNVGPFPWKIAQPHCFPWKSGEAAFLPSTPSHPWRCLTLCPQVDSGTFALMQRQCPIQGGMVGRLLTGGLCQQSLGKMGRRPFAHQNCPTRSFMFAVRRSGIWLKRSEPFLKDVSRGVGSRQRYTHSGFIFGRHIVLAPGAPPPPPQKKKRRKCELNGDKNNTEIQVENAQRVFHSTNRLCFFWSTGSGSPFGSPPVL